MMIFPLYPYGMPFCLLRKNLLASGFLSVFISKSASNRLLKASVPSFTGLSIVAMRENATVFTSLHYVDSDATLATLILIALAQHIVVSPYISTNIISLPFFPFFVHGPNPSQTAGAERGVEAVRSKVQHSDFWTNTLKIGGGG
jgi:hypothetical protein